MEIFDTELIIEAKRHLPTKGKNATVVGIAGKIFGRAQTKSPFSLQLEIK